jgi:hypothetical protein
MHTWHSRCAPGAHVKLPCMQRFPRRVPWSTREYLSMSRLHPTAALVTTLPSQCTCCGLAAAWTRAAGARKHCRSTCVGATRPRLRYGVSVNACVRACVRECVRVCGFACMLLFVRALHGHADFPPSHAAHDAAHAQSARGDALLHPRLCSLVRHPPCRESNPIDPSRGPMCGLCARMNMTHDARGLLPRLDICAGCAHTLVRQHTS